MKRERKERKEEEEEEEEEKRAASKLAGSELSSIAIQLNSSEDRKVNGTRGERNGVKLSSFPLNWISVEAFKWSVESSCIDACPFILSLPSL